MNMFLSVSILKEIFLLYGMGEKMTEETHLNVIEFCEMNDLIYKGFTITVEKNDKNDKLPDDKKKKTVIGLPDKWFNKDFSQKERFNNDPNVAIRCNKNILWIDTDEKKQNERMEQLLKERGIFEPFSITPSFKNRFFNLKYKYHYWFRVDFDELSKENYKINNEEIVPITNGKTLRNGWDVLYNDKGQIFEWSDSLIGNVPFMSFEDYEYIYKTMEEEFPVENNLPKPEPKKKIINDIPYPEEENSEDYSLLKEDSENTIQNLRLLCENIADIRWNRYDYWISIAMVFINEKYPIEIFHEYSEKRGQDKYDKYENEKYIDKIRAKPNGLRVATLYSWLKTDNFPIFEKIQQTRTDFWNYLLYHKNLNHLYYANIYYSLEPNKYLRSTETGWYEYNGYFVLKKRGNEIPKSMKNDISFVLQKYLTDQRNYIYPNDSKYKEKMELYKKCYQQLGVSSFINGIQDFLVNLYTVENIDELFDANSNLLCFEDKVFDLGLINSETTDVENLFRPISPKDYITKTTRYPAPIKSKNYNNIVKYLKDELLWSIFEDKKTVEYFLIITALSLFTTKLESLFIHTGSGGNGKGVLGDLIRGILGDYFYSPENTFLTTTFKAGSPNPSLYACRGVRYLQISEPDNNTDNKFNVDFVKLMTGGDPITTRTLYDKVNISYIPQFNPHCLCNQKPNCSKFDKGIVRRIKILVYLNNFVDNPRPGTRERKRDYTLKSKLSSDEYKHAYMILLLEYAMNWINRPVSDIEVPESVSKATEDYLDENNPVKGWINERLNITGLETDYVKTTDAYSDFVNVYRGRLSDRNFYNGMRMNDFEIHKSNGSRIFRGCLIKSTPQNECQISD